MPTINKTFNIEELELTRQKVEHIIELYENEYYSIGRISLEMQLSKETVRNILLANNVAMRKKNNKLSR